MINAAGLFTTFHASKQLEPSGNGDLIVCPAETSLLRQKNDGERNEFAPAPKKESALNVDTSNS